MRFFLLLLLVLIAAPVHLAAADNKILVVGDSISAGYGIATGAGWVDLLDHALQDHPCDCSVVNASISGETTDGGLRRLPELLNTHRPMFVVIELGGNDGLRGFPLNVTRDNLANMIELSKQAGASVLLIGMQIPPNYGPRYTQGFKAIFSSLAEQYQTGLVPFLLEGVATDVSLMQADGIHPNDAAQPLLMNNVLPTLDESLRSMAAGGSTDQG